MSGKHKRNNRQALDCASHGRMQAVMACQHIGREVLSEVFIVPADAEFPKQAWCNICELARINDRGWFDYADSIAQWRWFCNGCLEYALQIVPSVVQVQNPVATPDA